MTKGELDASNAALATLKGELQAARDEIEAVTPRRVVARRAGRQGERGARPVAHRDRDVAARAREIQRGRDAVEAELQRATREREALASRAGRRQRRGPDGARARRRTVREGRGHRSRSCAAHARPHPPPNRSWNGSAPSRSAWSRRSRTPRLVTRPSSPPPRPPPQSKPRPRGGPPREPGATGQPDREAHRGGRARALRRAAVRRFRGAVSKRSRPSSAISRWRRRCTTCRSERPRPRQRTRTTRPSRTSPLRIAGHRRRSPRSSRSTRRSRSRTSWGSRRS